MKWTSVCAAAVCLLTISSCGKEECKKGESECVDDKVLRTCVPSDDGNEWFTFSCERNETCGSASAPAAMEDGDEEKSDSGGGAACLGTCDTGSSECVSDVVARYCVDGRAWELQPCEAGQRCVEGACVYADGGVELCKPGARECGSDMTEKVCDRDGSRWIEQTCEKGDKCVVDRCAPDPDASCDIPSRCLDNKTAVRCLGETGGFEVVDCEGDTYCEGGRCRGTVCAIGSLCTEQNQVVECIAGETLKNSQCGVNEACKQQRDEAECVPKPCEPGVVKCGDPRDPMVDPEKFYSQCVPGSETGSGLPEWVTGECTGLLECDPMGALLGTPCQQECTPGAQACKEDPVFGVADGWSECQDDGTWGPVTSCNDGGGLRSQCVIKPNLDASTLPEALCAEPVCAYIINVLEGEGGACSAGQIQRCDEDGELLDPEPCELGICRAAVLETQADGRVPGACDIEVECEVGEERCLLDNLIPTSLYQTCENGFWSSRLDTCREDGQCVDFLDDEGLRKKVCGAQCAPGEKRCNISDQVETCNDDGEWSGASSCDVGVCATLGTMPGKRDAACVLECLPGERHCTGTEIAASDGVSFGYSQEAVCGNDGLLGAATACDDGTACRISNAGEHTGCVECLGPDVLGGNAFGYMDTRCDPDSIYDIQQCGSDNAWDASRVCTEGTTCRMVNGSTCGSCYINGTLQQCTETNLQAMGERCGPCTIPTFGTLTTCTNSQIVSLTSSTTMDTCETLFGDGPAMEDVGQAVGTTLWGGYFDCCDGATLGGVDGESLLTLDCATQGYGTPTPAGGVSDCCSLYVTAGSGAAFAYCAM